MDTAVGNLPDSAKIQKLINGWDGKADNNDLNTEVAKLPDTDKANIKKLIDAVKSAAADKDRDAKKTDLVTAAGKLNYPQTGKVAEGLNDVE